MRARSTTGDRRDPGGCCRRGRPPPSPPPGAAWGDARSCWGPVRQVPRCGEDVDGWVNCKTPPLPQAEPLRKAGERWSVSPEGCPFPVGWFLLFRMQKSHYKEMSMGWARGRNSRSVCGEMEDSEVLFLLAHPSRSLSVGRSWRRPSLCLEIRLRFQEQQQQQAKRLKGDESPPASAQTISRGEAELSARQEASPGGSAGAN